MQHRTEVRRRRGRADGEDNADDVADSGDPPDVVDSDDPPDVVDSDEPPDDPPDDPKSDDAPPSFAIGGNLTAGQFCMLARPVLGNASPSIYFSPVLKRTTAAWRASSSPRRPSRESQYPSSPLFLLVLRLPPLAL